MATEDSVAQDQIKAFVDRILRLKDESKAIAQDIREIYAEAKGNGFDKTVLGKLVLYVEKRQTDAAAIMESEALFDLYLTAYDGRVGRVGTDRATHTHAPEDRQARAKVRLSESMDDNKALSAEMLADGLISEEAHAENVALSDAVAVKLGAGVVDPVAALRADPTLAIVDVANLKKSEPQPAPQAGSDLTTPPSSQGQVAPHPVAKASEDDGANVIGESAPDDSVTGDASRASVGAGSDASISDADKSAGASASAAPAPIYAAPGIVVWEDHPPEGVERHEYSMAFGTIGQDIAVIEDDLAGAKAEPIVKMGKVILDGWARYMKARALGIEYPVIQYGGDDPMGDCIRWNLAGRILNDDQKRVIAQRMVKLYPQRKGPIFAEFGLGMELA